MPDPKMLSGELSLWSAVLLGQGETDWLSCWIKQRPSSPAASRMKQQPPASDYTLLWLGRRTSLRFRLCSKKRPIPWSDLRNPLRTG
jgi:hypothetical protein